MDGHHGAGRSRMRWSDKGSDGGALAHRDLSLDEGAQGGQCVKKLRI